MIFSRLPIAETRSIRFESGAALDAGACKGQALGMMVIVAAAAAAAVVVVVVVVVEVE